MMHNSKQKEKKAKMIHNEKKERSKERKKVDLLKNKIERT